MVDVKSFPRDEALFWKMLVFMGFFQITKKSFPRDAVETLTGPPGKGGRNFLGETFHKMVRFTTALQCFGQAAGSSISS